MPVYPVHPFEELEEDATNKFLDKKKSRASKIMTKYESCDGGSPRGKKTTDTEMSTISGTGTARDGSARNISVGRFKTHGEYDNEIKKFFQNKPSSRGGTATTMARDHVKVTFNAFS